MINRWFLIAIVWIIVFLYLEVLFAEVGTLECPFIDGKPVKIEAWLSKQYEKNLRQLRKEFSAMGNTRVTLWVYPAENPSKVVAIGRCVPAYIARHTLRKAVEY